jgi:hypothetical protein
MLTCSSKGNPLLAFPAEVGQAMLRNLDPSSAVRVSRRSSWLTFEQNSLDLLGIESLPRKLPSGWDPQEGIEFMVL